MASKKYSFLAGMLCLLASSGFSQTGYDVMDSSVVPDKRMPQYTNFKAAVENYPAKPRNMWEIGIKGGMHNLSSDVSSLVAPGFGVHVRKAFGYVFSARLEYVWGAPKGLSWLPAAGYAQGGAANPWQNLGYTTPVYYNYKSTVQDLSLEGIVSLNNIRFHKSKTGVNFYLLAGIGGMIYDTKVNALNGTTPYNFSTITAGTWKTRKDV